LAETCGPRSNAAMMVRAYRDAIDLYGNRLAELCRETMILTCDEFMSGPWNHSR
jgi:hypothetical protein